MNGTMAPFQIAPVSSPQVAGIPKLSMTSGAASANTFPSLRTVVGTS